MVGVGKILNNHQVPAVVRNTFHKSGLPRASSNLTLNISSDGGVGGGKGPELLWAASEQIISSYLI